MHQVPIETMRRTVITPLSVNNPVVQDLLWISKQQQKHPSLHAHPLKNTIRVNSRGIRFKFDGKQWRPLCQTTDGYECRNLAFRSSLCQKHFYKVHLFKRPYGQRSLLPPPSLQLPGIPRVSLKRSLPTDYEQEQAKQQNGSNDESEDTYEDDDSIEVIENNYNTFNKQETELSFFSIDCDPQTITDTSETNLVKSELSTNRSDGSSKRLNSTNNESIISTESESSSISPSPPRITESIRLGIPPLTRTEEKSLANELINHLPADVPFIVGEQMARRRVCEIVFDNYSQKLSCTNISFEWFYDFLLRNPRLPIHFQRWFSTVNPALPRSDQLLDIKIWELGLVTRSIIPSSSYSP